MPSQSDEESHQLSYLQKHMANILSLLSDALEGVEGDDALVCIFFFFFSFLVCPWIGTGSLFFFFFFFCRMMLLGILGTRSVSLVEELFKFYYFRLSARSKPNFSKT